MDFVPADVVVKQEPGVRIQKAEARTSELLITMKAVINNIAIAFEDRGDHSRTPIVLIHGFPFSRAMWQPQVDVLSAKHRVVAYDVRGHGESEVGDGQYMLEFFVDDFIALLDYLCVEKAAVVGLSMGGYIALRAIERNPERFHALVLCDTRSEVDSNEAKLKRAASVRTIKTKGLRKFAEEFVKNVFTPETFQANPDVVDFAIGIIERNSPIGICGALLALASRTDTTASLPNIGVPTLILVGEHDVLAPPTVAQAMKERIANADLHIVPDAAHMSNLENPEAFNHFLLKFIERLP